MNLDELRKLAEAAIRAKDWNSKVATAHRLAEELSPERILAMIACIEAADKLPAYEPNDDAWDAYDRARKLMEQEP